MMEVFVTVNGRLIAQASAINKSKLTEISTYECDGVEKGVRGSNHLHQFQIGDHHRDQSCWALVTKMAKKLAELENQSITANEGETL